MQEAIAPQLAAWESFYVIVGSSATPSSARRGIRCAARDWASEFIGIHNSWDTVTFIAVDQGKTKP